MYLQVMPSTKMTYTLLDSQRAPAAIKRASMDNQRRYTNRGIEPLLDTKDNNRHRPATPLQGKTLTAAYVTISAYLFLLLFCFMFQIYVIINPFTVSVTLAAKEQQVSLQGI